MTNRGHALSREEMVRTLTAYSGITTAAGDVVDSLGITLFDSNLIGRNDFISGKTILIMSGDAKNEDKGAIDFDKTDGKITLQAGFSAKIKAGTVYRILNISSVEMDVARIEDKIDSLAGGAFWGSYGPRNVEVDNDVDFGIMLYDPSGNIITTGEITPGTYTVHRIRVATDTEIVGSTASSEAAGRVYMTYNFPSASWNVGDIFYITFSGIKVTIDGVTTEYPDLYIWGRVVREADISSLIGTPTDAGDLATLFARANKIVLPIHAHVLLVVHDTSVALDADLDEALRDWMLDLGYEVTVADPADVVANLDVDAFDFIVISGSCLVGDAGNLANLRTADAPLLCHSAAIAESALFLGASAGSEADQTQIEIINNSPAWLIEQALGDLTVTASVAIQTLATEATNAIVIGEEATVTGTDLTIVKLPQGEQDDGSPSYAPFYDRYFNGVADYTNANAVWKALMAGFLHHMLHEKRFGEGTVQIKRAYQEQIPDVDFEKTAIDTTTSDPPSADAVNSIVDLDQRVNLTYVLRSLWVNVTSFGDGAQMTFQLWVLLNESVVSVDSVVVSALGIQNLMDIFGLREVHADGIWITAIVDVGSTGACSGTYRYAEARK